MRPLVGVACTPSALSALTALSALSAWSAFTASPALAQTDPRLVEVIRDAQEGQGDSARMRVQRLLASTSPTDTLYPQILYTQAMVASDASDMRRQLQRVAVEHSTSSWADDALLRLVQLDYASGNLDGAARNLERIQRDYPNTTLLPQASYWAARTYFDQKNPAQACRWLADGLAASRGNVELQNQLGYLNQRCSQVVLDTASSPATDTASSIATMGADTARPGVAAATPRTDSSPAVKPATPPSAPRSAPYRIQITAVGSAAAAQTLVTRLKGRGLSAVTLEEAGLYKVRVGSYANRADAVAALPEIKAKLGGSPFVVVGP